MKIALPNLSFPYITGLSSALKTLEDTCDIEVFVWNSEKPLMDMLDEIKPDLIFLYQHQTNIAIDLAAETLNFDYIVFSATPIQLNKKPIAYITDQEHISNFISYQKNTLVVKPSANVAQIHNGKSSDMFQSEISVFNNDVQLGPEHLKILQWLTAKYHTKLFGPQKIAMPQYLGSTDIFERADALKSSLVSIDLGNFSCLDMAYLKVAPVVLNGSNTLYRNFKSIKDLENILENLLNEKERKQYCDSVYQDVINGKTFYHRVSEIFQAIGDQQRSQGSLNKLKELIS